MAENFPYGNNLNTPTEWVGRMNAKSARWLVSYEGSFSIICGYHSFIFLGLESLNIGVVSLTNCGASFALPVGTLFKGMGAGAKTAKRIQDGIDHARNAKMSYDAAKTIHEHSKLSGGMELYERMKKAIPQFMISREPFSLGDLDGMPGGIAGAELEVKAAAALYYIEGYSGLIGDKIFGPQMIANGGDGLLSAGVSLGAGVWSVDTWFNLYFELGASALSRCLVEGQSPEYDQPYMQIPDLHPYLLMLPPAGCTLPSTSFNPARIMYE